ncbi:Uncharacterized protein APZ42_024953 [Daphnia magna]|uniref:Uncharacterized protein n=1 Tax=Daphnia magna TaxID=35525 RepID=A0A164TLC2_9CRUS|nr:Uncharacterized protein APZ42_024953 [Daphnia magna]
MLISIRSCLLIQCIICSLVTCNMLSIILFCRVYCCLCRLLLLLLGKPNCVKSKYVLSV